MEKVVMTGSGRRREPPGPSSGPSGAVRGGEAKASRCRGRGDVFGRLIWRSRSEEEDRDGELGVEMDRSRIRDKELESGASMVVEQGVRSRGRAKGLPRPSWGAAEADGSRGRIDVAEGEKSRGGRRRDCPWKPGVGSHGDGDAAGALEQRLRAKAEMASSASGSRVDVAELGGSRELPWNGWIWELASMAEGSSGTRIWTRGLAEKKEREGAAWFSSGCNVEKKEREGAAWFGSGCIVEKKEREGAGFKVKPT